MPDSIETLGWPLAFALAGDRIPPWARAPAGKEGVRTVRVLGRALAGMQKHALVDTGEGAAWSFFCDEGPYLNGTDLAPFPLAFFAAGGALCLMRALAVRLAAAGRPAEIVRRLEVDYFYSMEGSAIRGSMRAGALDPVVRVTGAPGSGPEDLRGPLVEALLASAIGALWREVHASRFSASLNGSPVLSRAEASAGEAAGDDPAALLARITPPPAGPEEPVIAKLSAAERLFGVEGGAGSSLAAEQKRQLHVRAILVPGADGLATVRTQLFKPIGSVFAFRGRFAADAPADAAPDGLAYLAAGIAFCFLTQIGRYAHIVKLPLEHYAVTQDMACSAADPARRHPAAFSPVVTDVRLTGALREEQARRIVAMGEQTCFLHAACRTPLKPRLSVRAATA